MTTVIEELLDVAQEAARLSVRAQFLKEAVSADYLTMASEQLVTRALELQASLTELPKEE